MNGDTERRHAAADLKASQDAARRLAETVARTGT